MITIAQAFLPAERRYRDAVKKRYSAAELEQQDNARELIQSIRKENKEVTRCLRNLEALLPDECDLKEEIQQYQQEQFIL